MQSEKIHSFAAELTLSAESGGLQNVVFHSPTAGDVLKIRGTLKRIGDKNVIQMETSLTEGRVTHENIEIGEILPTVERYFDLFRRADLCDNGGTASVMISKKGVVTFLKKGKIGSCATTGNAVPQANDREKRHLLTGEENFLRELGISDEKGRVHDKKQSKFRQICRFSEYIVDAEKKISNKDELYVCDLCCGKSYLSFAAYYVLTNILGRRVRMTCVDLKQSVMDYCADIAEKCGMNGMEFLCMNIDSFQPNRSPDLVISLHACDTATDIVLDFASKNKAQVILATPCCHHQMNNELNCPTLDFIADRPILKQKLCTAATDALRLLKLEAEGYKTDATELIDPEDTPKNVMLRAHRIKNFDENSDAAKVKRERYLAAYTFLYGKAPNNQ